MSGGGLSNIASQVGQMRPSGGTTPSQGMLDQLSLPATQPTQATPSKFNQPNTGWNQQQFTTNPNTMSPTSNWWTNTEMGRSQGGQEGLNTTLRNQIQGAMGNYGNMVDYANRTGISQQDIQNAIGGNTDMYTYMNRPNYQQFGSNGQFNQPIYQSNYQNYARPATQFDVSMYGTQPVYSPARSWNDRNAGSAEGGRAAVNNAIGNFYQNNPNASIDQQLAAMRDVGINRTDIQSWGGVNNYGPQMSFPQMSTPFNPYTNSYQSPFSTQAPMARTSSGPSQAIVGRSSSLRGTPNVVARKAKGGIASLMDDVA